MNSRTLAALVSALVAGCSPNPNNDPADTGMSSPDMSVTDAASDRDAARHDMAAADAGADASDGGFACDRLLEPIPTPDRIHTPRWAFLPWISKDISDRDDTYAFVDGFIDRDIPVGVVVLDSPWETQYNTFVPNPDRYPEFPKMVSDMEDRGVRIVLWVTQMVNEASLDFESGGDRYEGPSPNFPEGLACDYFIDDGKTFTWWKGKGAGVDFFNPAATSWWREQQDDLLEMGVAGWKLDFGEEYVTSDVISTFAGDVTHQEYSEAYYRDFYEYGIYKVGHDDFVTMVRGYDKSYQFEGRFFARPEHAPVVWAGDNRRDWIGLEDALDHMFRSAEAGYVVVGSDLGGYMDRDDQDIRDLVPFNRANFLRWLAASAMSPFMQLHGRANLTPWTLPDDPDSEESVALYRYWSHLHTELIPFLYSVAEESYAGRADGLLRPLGAEADWAGDYRYMLGDAFLVAPILDDTGARDIELPEGVWYDWWDVARVENGDATVSRDYADDLQRIPLFVKQGAIVPIDPLGDVTQIVSSAFTETDVVLGWPSTTDSTFARHDEDGDSTTFALTDRVADVRFLANRSTNRLVARLRLEAAPTGVTLNGTALAAAAELNALASADGYFVESPYLWVSVGPTNEQIEVVATR